MKGGSGRNGGAGGRFAIVYGFINFIGEYYSDGGVGNGGENAAAGTVFTKDTGANGTKILKIYNREGEGVSANTDFSMLEAEVFITVIL